MSDCPFCELVHTGEFRWANESSVGFFDRFPVSEGHALVIPRSHDPDLFNLDDAVRQAVWSLVDIVRSDLHALFAPDGFNIGANVGSVAGQTVDHAHVHVIPRYRGDLADPRGGVRWVLPDRADYWS